MATQVTQKPSLEKFLKQNKLVRQDHAKYYAYHVKGFVYFCKGMRSNLNWENVSLFLQQTSEKLEDWQMRQADNALTMYLGNYLKNVHGNKMQTPGLA